jgi:hypothetical protein
MDWILYTSSMVIYLTAQFSTYNTVAFQELPSGESVPGETIYTQLGCGSKQSVSIWYIFHE